MRALAVCLLFISCFAPSFAQEKNAFDAKSFKNTFAWTVEAWKPVQDAARNNNDLARAAHEKKLLGAFADLKGTEIDWMASVLQVRSDGILLATSTKSGSETIHFKLLAHNSKIAQKPFPAPDADWVLQLKTNDTVRLQGKIGDATLPSRGTTKTVALTISDYKLSPVVLAK